MHKHKNPAYKTKKKTKKAKNKNKNKNKNNDAATLNYKLPPLNHYVVIGLGGVGGRVAEELCGFLNNTGDVADVVLVDGDIFEPKNAGRMRFKTIGPKAAVIAEELEAANDNVVLTPYCEFVTTDNVDELIKSGSVVFLCVDNHPTRKLVAKFCQKLKDVVLISGGNDGVENGKLGTFGNAQINVRRKGEDLSPPIDKFHPEIAKATDTLPHENCTQMAVSQPQLRFTNMRVACDMLALFYAYLCNQLKHGEVCFDIFDGRSAPQFQLPEPVGV